MKRYESATRVVAAFFAVLLGFGLKQMLDGSARLEPASASGPCFIACVLLFLRFLVGSSNHMWVEFVLPDLRLESKFSAPAPQIVADFSFLILFGLLGVAICYARNLHDFMELNMVWGVIGLAWSFLDGARGWLSDRLEKRRGSPLPPPRVDWGRTWFYVNAAQVAVIALLWRPVISQGWGPVGFWPSWLPQPPWNTALLCLVLAYAILLFADVRSQLKILAKVVAPPAQTDGPLDKHAGTPLPQGLERENGEVA
jgi:hypothetical protein